MAALAIVGLVAGLVPGVAGAQTAAGTPEHNLAIIQQGWVRADHPLVAALGAQLDAMQPKCVEDRVGLADVTAGAHVEMKKRGVAEAPLSILENVNLAIPDAGAPHKCFDLFVAYALLRTGG